MAYLIDTDIYIFLTAGDRAIRDRIREIGAENIFLSAVSVAELYYGAFRSANQPDNLKVIRAHLEKLQILNFTKNTAKVFGRLKAELNRVGKAIADMDLAIASIAVHHQYTLVTHNTRHFQNIRELVLEDWKG